MKYILDIFRGNYSNISTQRVQDRLIFVRVYGELRGTSFVDRIDADEAARAAGASERVACAPARSCCYSPPGAALSS